MTKVLRGLFILILVAACCVVGASYYLSGVLLMRDKPRSAWSTPKKPQCSTWMRNVAFADLRPGNVPGENVDFSCEDGEKLPHGSFEARASTGMRIHYNVYASPLPATVPLFLHIHGVSGSYLHGARYAKAAERMGFQLVAMDLSNHGLSDHDGKGAAYGCREGADVVAVVEDLKERFPDRGLYLHSTSMGAMSLANALPRLMASDAKSHRIVALSLENPITSVRELVVKSPQTPPVPRMMTNLGIAIAGWRAGYNFDTCRPVDNVRFARVPVLVQWSEKDDIVPRSIIKDFMAALPADIPNSLEVYSGGGHSAVWNGEPERYERETLANFREGQRLRAAAMIGRSP